MSSPQADYNPETYLGQILARLFTNTPVSVAILQGPEHVFVMANPAYEKHVGYRKLIGLNIREAFPELVGQDIYDLLDEVRNTGKPYISHDRQLDLDRGQGVEDTYVNFVYEPMPETDSILVIAFDQTDLQNSRLEAEAQRIRATASEEQLKHFIDNLPTLAWTARPDGFIDYYNRRWYEYTGTTFEELKGWGWEKVHDPALLPKVLERWQHSLASGEPFEMEFTLRGADGIARWFLTRIVPSHDTEGRIIRWFGTNTNIDEIRSAQALSEAMAAQSLDVQQMLLEMRQQKERAEQRVVELEALLKEQSAQQNKGSS